MKTLHPSDSALSIMPSRYLGALCADATLISKGPSNFSSILCICRQLANLTWNQVSRICPCHFGPWTVQMPAVLFCPYSSSENCRNLAGHSLQLPAGVWKADLRDGFLRTVAHGMDREPNPDL